MEKIGVERLTALVEQRSVTEMLKVIREQVFAIVNLHAPRSVQ